MKTIGTLLLSLLFFASCNNTKNNKTLTREERLESITSMDTLYAELSVIDIPFSSNENLVDITKLPRNFYHLFSDSDKFDENTRIARLPEYDMYKPIVLFYDSGKAIDLYTLSPDMDIADRLQVYSIEGEGKSKDLIIRRFNIQPDYRIRVCKDLIDVEIESLFYEITPEGTFREIRDGETPATAFESFDNETYYVESFIWKKNPNSLEKLNVRKSEYKLTDTGDVEKIK